MGSFLAQIPKLHVGVQKNQFKENMIPLGVGILGMRAGRAQNSEQAVLVS